MNPLSLPEHIWVWSSAIIVAAIAGATALVGHWFGSRKTKQDGLAVLVDQLQEEITRVAARVEKLEQERDAYRNHAYVLHEWGGTIQTPENPRPGWPAGLPR